MHLLYLQYYSYQLIFKLFASFGFLFHTLAFGRVLIVTTTSLSSELMFIDAYICCLILFLSVGLCWKCLTPSPYFMLMQVHIPIYWCRSDPLSHILFWLYWSCYTEWMLPVLCILVSTTINNPVKTYRLPFCQWKVLRNILPFFLFLVFTYYGMPSAFLSE